jgi:hypothetical protein
MLDMEILSEAQNDGPCKDEIQGSFTAFRMTSEEQATAREEADSLRE